MYHSLGVSPITNLRKFCLLLLVIGQLYLGFVLTISTLLLGGLIYLNGFNLLHKYKKQC